MTQGAGSADESGPPLEDADCSAELTKSFKKRKIEVLIGAKISDVQVGKTSVKMNVESGGANANELLSKG